MNNNTAFDLLESQDKDSNVFNSRGNASNNLLNNLNINKGVASNQSKFLARSNSAKNNRNTRNNQNDLTLSMINNNNFRESSPIRKNNREKDQSINDLHESQNLKNKYYELKLD